MSDKDRPAAPSVISISLNVGVDYYRDGRVMLAEEMNRSEETLEVFNGMSAPRNKVGRLSCCIGGLGREIFRRPGRSEILCRAHFVVVCGADLAMPFAASQAIFTA